MQKRGEGCSLQQYDSPMTDLDNEEWCFAVHLKSSLFIRDRPGSRSQVLHCASVSLHWTLWVSQCSRWHCSLCKKHSEMGKPSKGKIRGEKRTQYKVTLQLAHLLSVTSDFGRQHALQFTISSRLRGRMFAGGVLSKWNIDIVLETGIFMNVTRSEGGGGRAIIYIYFRPSKVEFLRLNLRS